MGTDKIIIILTALVAVVSIGSEVYRRHAGKVLSNRILEALYSGDLSTFDQLMDSKRAKRLIPLFNRKFLLLNKSLLQGERRPILAQLEEFEQVRMSDVQKASVYAKAFFYFLSCEDKKNTTKYYHLLKENKAYEDQKNLERIYDTYALKGYRYLEETKAEAEGNPFLLSMVADMYLNQGDQENARKYAELVRECQEKTS